METLREFLKEQEENIVWFLTPSGLVSGKLQIHPDGFDKAQNLILSSAVFFSGDISIDIYEATILLDHISGWGAGEPIFIDKEY